MRLEGGRNSGCIIGLYPTMSTAYHAKYFAYELTKRCASDSMEKLAASLADAQVDLNPHQVEAALFAFRSHYRRERSSPTKLVSEKRLRLGFSYPRDGLNAKERFSSSSRQPFASSGIRSFQTSSSCLRSYWRPRPLTNKFERGTSIRSTAPRSSSARTSSPGRKTRTCVRFLGT